MNRAWLHCHLLFPCALPVRVLACGPKRAHVQLVHRLRWNRQWYPAGSTRYVPTGALGSAPSPGYLVGVGRGHFVNPARAEAKEAVKKWSSK